MEESDFQSKSEPIIKLATMDPTRLSDHLAETHQSTQDVAPNIAPHVNAAAVNAVQYLSSKLPSGGPDLIQDRPQEPSVAEKKQWLDLHSIVDDPTSVLSHIEKGTLNASHVEALKTVYPDLHNEMVSKISEELGKLKSNHQEIPYPRRMQLSLLMDTPLDTTMTQPVMAAIINANAQKAPQKKTVSSSTATTQSKLNKMYQTPDQARAARRTTGS